MNAVLEWVTRFATGLHRIQKMTILLLVDVALVPLSLWLTLTFVQHESASDMFAMTVPFWVLVFVMSVSGGIFSLFFGLPRIKLNAFEQSGIQRTAGYATLVGLVGIAASQVLFGPVSQASDMAVFTMVLLIISVSTRLLLRNLTIWLYHRGQVRQRVLIYGAGQTGVQLATALYTDDTVVPIAYIDDNKTLQNITVAGLPVLSPLRIEALISELAIDRVVLAMPSISPPKQARIARRFEDLSVQVSTLPSFASLVGEGGLLDRIQPVNPSDYLGRDNLECDLQGLCDIYTGQTVMITGAGGSIGSELTRQILSCRPARLILFENSEYALYQLNHELEDLGITEKGVEICPVLGSVTNDKAVRRTIANYDVGIVLHAAAYKHVPLVEENRLAGLHNNVIGTKIVAEAARDLGVSHFILVSTDKAVQPTSVMGASKRLAELFVQDLASRVIDTRFGIVRFGNVLGSSGSVVPLFSEQIARGGPVTLTHQEVTRYFMTLSEAARLVLMAGNYTGMDEGHGDVFLLDMGDPIPIKRLARQMIEAAGHTVCDAANPSGDIEIIITGLRPGEKLHEELVMQKHAQWATQHPKINRVEEERLSEIEAATALRDLNRAIETDDEQLALDVIDRWVYPSFKARAARKMAQPRRPLESEAPFT
ncbi:polysaccharide biosynthesis protein [Pseudooctadecabacter sp.]|uniref:polysaccharide biosynthesis protein n=1 Tax=Pseudooctadecabacter sp. TaxID=1966338 RepID=UPI003F6A72AA